MRRSHAAYRWRSLAQGLGLLLRAGFFVGSAAGLAVGAHRLWSSSSALAVASVRLDGDVPEGLDRGALPAVGRPIFGFRRRAVEDRLRTAHPGLASVRVRRGWDRSVRVEFIARTAVARQAAKNGWSAVDADGVLFPLSGGGEALPVLSTPDDAALRRDALELLAGLRATKERWTESLYKIKMSSDGEATVFLAGDTPVLWGPGDADPAARAAKARRLARVLAAPEGANGYDHVRFVDDRRVVAMPRAAPRALLKEKRAQTRTDHRP